ncbi:hypothetical protein [Falsirhodobacter xinxiangensis]|uniref:hypothetical protein n=1 Tax=Falsirhodobacter xinxiangensis TaxID=2530049 RepID=UPI0010A9DA93|nr:hypothetical protein [Rhodobacter xinxiangensis]
MRIDLCEYARRLESEDYTKEQIDMIVAFARESAVSSPMSGGVNLEMRALERRLVIKIGCMLVFGFIYMGLILSTQN